MSLGKTISPRLWRGALVALLGVTAVGVALWTRQIESRNGLPSPVSATPRYDAVLASMEHPAQARIDFDRVAVPRPLHLRSGQTLSGLLAELGVEPRAAQAAVEELARHLDMRRLRAGEVGLAYFDPASSLASLRLKLDRGRGWVELARRGSAWESSVHEFERDVEVRRIEGRLDGFLEEAIVRAGGMREVAYAMSFVLQWDLDFNRDLRTGDRFQVLYEEVYLDGEHAGVGEVLALAYENRGRRLEAYRHDGGRYYDAEGRPLQKMFLRSPLPFTRVTSRFSARRFHPVLKVHRPHWGVDYGAPRGTPVRVTASGTVTFAGRNGGAGKMVKVRHPNGYETSYLHLSGYARGIGRGQRVAQGDLIGYVGSTGLSTGAHLDYRMRKNGRYIDPLKLKRVPAKPIPREELGRFLERRDVLRASLVGDRLPPQTPFAQAPPLQWAKQQTERGRAVAR